MSDAQEEYLQLGPDAVDAVGDDFADDDGSYLQVGDVDQESSKAEAVAEWVPQTEQEIELKVGDLIAVDLKETESGWWVGTNTRTGNTGLFPGSYVEEIEWTEAEENEIFQYNDELLKLADELGQFEGGELACDSADMLFDTIATELGLVVPLALKSGFCDLRDLDDDAFLKFFTRQVVCAIVNRSDVGVEEDVAWVSLLNGEVTSTMFEGEVATAMRQIEEAIELLAQVPPERSEIAVEFMQSQFSGHAKSAATLGKTGIKAVGDAMVAILASVETLSKCPGLRSRWASLVETLREAEDPTVPISFLQMMANKLKDAKDMVSAAVTKISETVQQAVGAAPAKEPKMLYSQAVKNPRHLKNTTTLQKSGATAHTAALLTSFKTKKHVQSFRKQKELDDGRDFVSHARTRKHVAPAAATATRTTTRTR